VKRKTALFWLIAVGLLCAGLSPREAAAVTIATIGDSYTDGYAGQGYTHRAWTDLIGSNPTGADFGAGGALNFAVRGHTTAQAVNLQRPQLLANLAQADYVVIDIGLNDLHGIAASGGGLYKPFTYLSIGQGNAAVTTTVTGNVVNNIKSIVNSIRTADPNKKIILASVPDWGSTVAFRKPVIDLEYDIDFRVTGGKANEALRRTFTRAVKQQINNPLIAFAQQNDIVVINKLRLMATAQKVPDIAFTPTTRINTQYHPGFREAEGGPYAMWADGLHPGTAWQGIYANVILGILRDYYGENVDTLTAQQIMSTYGGTAPLPADDVHRAWGWQNYAILPPAGTLAMQSFTSSLFMAQNPEPASAALLLGGALMARRSRRGRFSEPRDPRP